MKVVSVNSHLVLVQTVWSLHIFPVFAVVSSNNQKDIQVSQL